MAGEALVRLARGDDEVRRWTERYARRLEPLDRSSPDPIEVWREALGKPARFADWLQLFDRALADGEWEQVVGAWAVRLLPGVMSSALHGVIRTAHAARMLAASDTAPRRHELAQGLAYWAARYQALPGTPRPQGALPLDDASRAVPRLPAPGRGLIFDAVRALDDEEGFAEAVDGLAPPADPRSGLDELIEHGARLYLANADREAIVFVHAVTGPAAVRELIGLLDQPAAADAHRYAWQAVAALVATYARDAPPVAAEAPPDLTAAIERACEGGDEHAIKLAEVCVSEFSRTKDDVFLRAVGDVSERLTTRP